MNKLHHHSGILWTLSVALIIFWLLGLIIADLADPFIHVLCGAAIILLVIGITREVGLNRKLRHPRSRG